MIPDDLSFDSRSLRCHGNIKNYMHHTPQFFALLSELLSAVISFALLHVSYQKG